MSGGARLTGEVQVVGAKNSVLKLMAAALRGSEQRLPSQLTPVVVPALELRAWLMPGFDPRLALSRKLSRRSTLRLRPPASKSPSRQNYSNRNR